MSEYDVQWSSEVEQADWTAERLSPFHSGAVTSVVPSGFEAYTRLLHPAPGLGDSGARARWAQVAAWSGVPLEPVTQFHELALPEHQPAGPAPWSGHAAAEGTLDAADLDALVGVLAEHTATPEHCWFCLWEGYGWDTSSEQVAAVRDDLAARGMPLAADLLDPVPAAVRAGPRVQLPHRSHLLYTGPIAAASAFVDSHHQSPTLWWPADRAWCVATEIDLSWTYVGGTTALIERLVAEPHLEAQRVCPDDSHHQRVPPWLEQVIERVTNELFARGHATLHTWRGSLRAELELPQGSDGDGSLRTAFEHEDPLTGPRSGSGWMRLHDYEPNDERLREVITRALAIRVIDSLGS